MVEIEFYRIISDIIRSKEYRGMKNCRHHVKGSVYDHSVKAAALSDYFGENKWRTEAVSPKNNEIKISGLTFLKHFLIKSKTTV